MYYSLRSPAGVQAVRDWVTDFWYLMPLDREGPIRAKHKIQNDT